MEFKNLSFPVKMMLGYLVGILILAFLLSAGVLHISTIFREYDKGMKSAWRQLDALQQVRAAGLRFRIQAEAASPRSRNELKDMDRWFQAFLEESRGGTSTDIVPLVRNYYGFRKQVNSLDLSPGLKDSEKYRDFVKKYDFFMGSLYVEISRAKNYVEVSETNFLKRINELLLVILFLAPLSFLFFYIYGFFVSNSTGLRLKRFLAALKKLVAGQQQTDIKDNSRDELGQIAQGVNKLAHKDQ